MMKEFHNAPWSIKLRARLRDGFSTKRSTAVGFARQLLGLAQTADHGFLVPQMMIRGQHHDMHVARQSLQPAPVAAGEHQCPGV